MGDVLSLVAHLYSLVAHLSRSLLDYLPLGTAGFPRSARTPQPGSSDRAEPSSIRQVSTSIRPILWLDTVSCQGAGVLDRQSRPAPLTPRRPAAHNVTAGCRSVPSDHF